MDYEILYYELYDAPKRPTESIRGFFCKTETLEEADSIAQKSGKNGRCLCIKAVCSDGRSRFVL